MKRVEKPVRLFDILDIRRSRFTRRPCFRHGNRTMAPRDYRRDTDALSHALIMRGLQRGEAVALIADNRPEWNIIDMAVMQAGGVLLSLCKGLSAEEYTECLSKAHVRMLFVEDEELYGRFRLLLPQVDTLEYLLSIEPVEAATPLEQLLREGRINAAPDELARRRALVSPDDVCTLVYSGGGTYRKVTHRSLIEDILNHAADEHITSRPAVDNTALCTLYGRMKNYTYQLVGRTVEYAA